MGMKPRKGGKPPRKGRKPSRKKVRDEQARKAKQIRAMLDEAESKLQSEGWDTVTLLSENTDGSIDSELRIKLPRGETPFSGFLALQDAVYSVPRTWVSTGIMMPPFTDGEDYEKMGGRLIAYANPQRSTRYLYNIEGGRDVAKRAKKNRRRNPDWVFQRVHWNPEDKRPPKMKGRK